MTTKQIEAKQQRETSKFETAKKIRELLDELKKTYGSDYEDEDVESQVHDLVFEAE